MKKSFYSAMPVLIITAYLTALSQSPVLRPPAEANAVPYSSHTGQFVGTIEAKWSDDGRNMTLTAPFLYIDPQGVHWDASAGTVTDGASIPKAFWSIIGGPFEGKYRNAAVIHDAACQSKMRSWESTHLMFYQAMLTSHVTLVKAKVMYAAVYHFGPRWDLHFSEMAPKDTDIDELVAEVQSKVGATASTPTFGSSVMQLAGPEVQLVGVTFVAPKETLTRTQFKALQAMIERRETKVPGSVSLEQIRNFVQAK